MDNRSKFSTFRRDQLTNVLQRYGCEESAKVVSQMEKLTREYHRSFLSQKDKRPAIESLSQARSVIHYANVLCEELDVLNPESIRLFERERERRDEELSFDRYKEAANDICMFAVFAVGKAETRVKRSQAPADVAIRHLVSKLIGLWIESTGCYLPSVPARDAYSNDGWQYQHILQCHPIWIVLNELGISLDWYALTTIVDASNACRGEYPEATREAV